ncbi:MAG TPA: peroxiredoxin [Bacteroides sp.]|nr:peroxiredoxin [Bacteroides sp.]
MKRIIPVAVIFLMTASLATSQVKLGGKVPNFSAIDQEGSAWNLKKNLKTSEYLVIYFYPAAFTGGCTAQACSYRDQKGDLEAVGAQVVGISGDSPATLELFAKEHRINFRLLSDASGEIADLFGVPRRDGGHNQTELGGKTWDIDRGTTIQRWTFILDKKGTLIYKDPEVEAAGDSQRVVEFLSTL